VSSGADLFVVCKSCGSEVSPYITECPYCGNRLRKRAPKLDKGGQPKERKARAQRKPRLPRLRPGEMPGIRFEARPYATLALVLAGVVLATVIQAGGLALSDVAIAGKLGGEGWRVVTALFAYDNQGYLLATLFTVALFGWLIERRHGWWAVLLVFFAGGAGGMFLAATLESVPVALGANGAALALLGAWVVPDLQARRRNEETDSDLLGVVVIAAVMLLMPLAVPEADPVAGAGGALIGLALGVPLARTART
jgi:membrane associated rhomboid family serine protease